MNAATCPERIHLDMTAIVAQAQAPKLRRWRVEFESGGIPFVWTGEAITSTEAAKLAWDKLRNTQGFFVASDAHLISCCEVSA